MTRDKVLGEAIDSCLKEIYQWVTPKVEWEIFVEENKLYSKKLKAWERFKHLFNKREKLTKEEFEEFSEFPSNWMNKSITECIGPRPYEFYYIPKEILKDICDSYIHAYRLDSQQELLDTIEILKDYCKDPIVDKYIDEYTDEYGNHHPGYRGYDHPDNLEKEIKKILGDVAEDNEYYQHKLQNKFFEFLDKAGEFYNWNRDLNTFNTSVYLGPSPNSNKQAVIDNWKKYKNQDITIEEDNKLIKEYYGEED